MRGEGNSANGQLGEPQYPGNPTVLQGGDCQTKLVACIQCSGMSPNEVRATRIGRQLSDKLVACNQCFIFSANKM
jgi:hypothetical protein